MHTLFPLFAILIAMLFPSTAFSQGVGDDGLYDSPLFTESFLDLGEDLTEAGAQGKTLVLIIEQRGCPYCREMHEVNFKREDISRRMQSSFLAIQLDLWGSREVTGFDGKPAEEREFIRELGAQFTPTSIFYDEAGKEVFRMPGYFKPFHHLSVLEYVAEGAYEEQDFQRFLQAKFEKLEAEGKDPKVWE